MKLEKATLILIKISLIAIFSTDALTKYILGYVDYPFLILPNRVLKVLMIISTLVIILRYIKSLHKIVIKIYALLLILFLTSIVNYVFFDLTFEYFIRYSYFFFIAPLFFIKINAVRWQKEVVNTLKYLLYINFFFVVIGLLIDFQLFKTYFNRFGYNGLLITPMQTTYFYIGSIIVAIKSKQRTFLILGLISALLAGTKTLLGFLAFLSCYFIIAKKRRTKLIVPLGIFILFTFYAFLQQKSFSNTINTKGLMYALTSSRSNLLISFFDNLPTTNFNIITGGVSLKENRVEMEIIDVLMYFGLLGCIVYYYLYRQLYVAFVKENLSVFYYFAILLFVLVAGNFLYNPINCFMILIALKTLQLRFSQYT
jgi:hypothetical protein